MTLSKRPTGRCGSSLSTRMTWRTASCGSFFDTQARLLETVVLVFAGGDEMVIHAMSARRQYWDLLS